MDVTRFENDAVAIGNAAGLTWNPTLMNLAVQGRRDPTVFRPIDSNAFGGHKAIVRSDTGAVLDVGASGRFEVHKNSEILTGICTAAKGAGMLVSDVKALFGGRDVIVSAKHMAKGKGEAVKGDVLEGRVVVYASHRIGRATTYWTEVLRLVCGNGLTSREQMGRMRVTHRRQIAPGQAEMNQIAMALGEQLGLMTDRLGTMAETRLTDMQVRLYLANVAAPELLDAVIAETGKVRRVQARAGVDMVGRVALSEMLEAVDSSRVVGEVLLKGWEAKKRSLNRLLDAIVEQPGSEYAPGTVYNAYNAVTWQVDHGRETDASRESALLGDGRERKERALELGVEYVQALRGQA